MNDFIDQNSERVWIRYGWMHHHLLKDYRYDAAKTMLSYFIWRNTAVSQQCASLIAHINNIAHAWHVFYTDGSRGPVVQRREVFCNVLIDRAELALIQVAYADVLSTISLQQKSLNANLLAPYGMYANWLQPVDHDVVCELYNTPLNHHDSKIFEYYTMINRI